MMAPLEPRHSKRTANLPGWPRTLPEGLPPSCGVDLSRLTPHSEDTDCQSNLSRVCHSDSALFSALPSAYLLSCAILIFFNFIIFMYVCVYVFYTMCVQCLQKLRVVSDFLELELRMSMRCHVGARNLTRVFRKSSLCF